MTRHSLLAACTLLLACKGSPDNSASATPAVSASTSVAVAPAPSSAPKQAWFEGEWRGRYHSELQKLETAAGAPKQWQADDGSTASGEGKLTLQAQADGTVLGTATGPLGEHTISGKIEDEHVALSLVPAKPDGFRGVIVARQKAQAIEGTLNASSGDSLQARRGMVSLTRNAP